MSTPVSGPGQFSKRTDKAVGQANRSLPNADYGEQAQYQQQLQGAPMAQGGGTPDFASMFGNPAAGVIGLGADTIRPDEPGTTGAALGPGAGPEVLGGGGDDTQGDSAQLKPYMLALEFMANQPGSSTAARNLVRQLRASQ